MAAPPKPRLFRAIAILAMLLGSFGITNAVGGLLEESRSAPRRQRALVEAMLPPATEDAAQATRKIEQKMQRLAERHRAVSVGLHAANAVLSLLLLAGALTLASGRPWAHWVMMQALAASMLYELPSVAHEVRLIYEAVLVQRRYLPQLIHLPGQTMTSEEVALSSGVALVFLIAMTVGLAVLRLAFYGTGFWYLRRRDVRAWFSLRDTP